MNNFFQSFSPILKKLKLQKYFVEILLLSLASIITIVALGIYLNNFENNHQTAEIPHTSLASSRNMIFVDVSGAVKKPGLYEFGSAPRIKEVIDKAGGLSEEVDIVFFKRNFNLARIVNDQEKIYVPSITEVSAGIFIQNLQSLDYISPVSKVINEDTSIDNQLASVNYATVEELDQLPGIGQVTANKIVFNRPYSSIEELLTKKAINKNVYEKIKNLISL